MLSSVSPYNRGARKGIASISAQFFSDAFEDLVPVAPLPLAKQAHRRKRGPTDSLQFATLLAQSSFELLVCGQHAAAEPLLRECLAIRDKHIPDNWLKFNTQALLGGSLLGQKKYAECEPLLLKGYAGMKARAKTIPESGEAQVLEAVDRLVDLYTATNKPNDVHKWRAERAKYPQDKTKAPEMK